MNKEDLIHSTLNNQLRLNETNVKLQHLVNVITAGGEEAIREVAESDPSLIVTVLTSLATLLDATFKSNNQLLEYWMNGMDREHKYAEFLEDIAKKIYEA